MTALGFVDRLGHGEQDVAADRGDNSASSRSPLDHSCRLSKPARDLGPDLGQGSSAHKQSEMWAGCYRLLNVLARSADQARGREHLTRRHEIAVVRSQQIDRTAHLRQVDALAKRDKAARREPEFSL